MHNNNDYPLGADNDLAPWNEPLEETEDIDITISVTLSKTIKVTVPKGIEYNIKDYISEQLPQDKCPDWNVDDFEIIEE